MGFKIFKIFSVNLVLKYSHFGGITQIYKNIIYWGFKDSFGLFIPVQQLNEKENQCRSKLVWSHNIKDTVTRDVTCWTLDPDGP